MMMRKACPRCRGDLFLDRADGPVLWTCLQCGRSFAPRAKQPDAGHDAVAIVDGRQEQAA